MSDRKFTVKQDKSGVWYAKGYLGIDARGKQIRPCKRFSKAESREEAQRMCDEWARSLTADGKVRSMRLVDLLNEYIDMKESNGMSPSTVRKYRCFANNYVANYLKNANAAEVTAIDFQRFEGRLLTPKASGGQGLARNSVLFVHWFLQGAYKHFVNIGICESNPVLNVVKPERDNTEAHALNEVGFERISDALESAMESGGADSVYSFAAWLALVTGMRVGEVCAVRKCDVRRVARDIHVGGTVIEEKGKKPYRRDVTKGKKSRNVAVTDEDMARINAHISACSAITDDGPIVTVDGSYIRPSVVSKHFSALRDELGLPKQLKFHSLRHTHATWCLMNGVDLKTLSERLGHADPATTLRAYSHVMPGRDKLAAQAFADAAKKSRG